MTHAFEIGFNPKNGEKIQTKKQQWINSKEWLFRAKAEEKKGYKMHKNRIDLRELLVSQQQQQVKYPQVRVSWVRTKKALISQFECLVKCSRRIKIVACLRVEAKIALLSAKRSILYHKEFLQCIYSGPNDSSPFLSKHCCQNQ